MKKTMTKTISKKLAVSKTTLRNLTTADLEGVVGGKTFMTCSDLCTESNAC